MVDIPAARQINRVLITGSSGFLGKHLIKLAPHHVKITAHYCCNKPYDYGKIVSFFSQNFIKSDFTLHNVKDIDTIITEGAPYLSEKTKIKIIN